MRCTMSSRPTSQGKQNSQPLPIVRCLKFDLPHAFAFEANGDGRAWTPNSIERELGIKKFGNLQKVHVQVRGDNLEEVAALIEWWTQYDFPVVLSFPNFDKAPSVGTEKDPYPFGLSEEECYFRRGRRWYPSPEFCDEVAGFFARYRLVTCDQCHA